MDTIKALIKTKLLRDLRRKQKSSGSKQKNSFQRKVNFHIFYNFSAQLQISIKLNPSIITVSTRFSEIPLYLKNTPKLSAIKTLIDIFTLIFWRLYTKNKSIFLFTTQYFDWFYGAKRKSPSDYLLATERKRRKKFFPRLK